MSGPIVHVAGARPNFPKLAPVHAALESRRVSQMIVHTGQHFDDALSGVFFRQLGIPEPDANLGIAAASGAAAVGRMIVELGAFFTRVRPRCVVVYGDVNSTLAAAVAAQKTGIPSVHVEAGLRSYDRGMPEEINRVLTDQICDVLLVTSEDAIDNLSREGIVDRHVQLVGNPMIDTLLSNIDRFDTRTAETRFGLTGQYGVVTIHRPSNIDSTTDAREVAEVIREVASQIPVVFPIHPRGRVKLAAVGLEASTDVRIVDPLGYLEFMGLVRGARLVLTDSGGVQEETTVFGVPCLTLRENTERPVTITHGTNRLVSRREAGAAASEVLSAPVVPGRRPPLWDGRAGERIAAVLADHFAVAPPGRGDTVAADDADHSGGTSGNGA